MKNNATRFLIITGIFCFLAGGVLGYVIRSNVKMTPEEIASQFKNLNQQETIELVNVLGRVLSEPREVKK